MSNSFVPDDRYGYKVDISDPKDTKNGKVSRRGVRFRIRNGLNLRVTF